MASQVQRGNEFLDDIALNANVKESQLDVQDSRKRTFSQLVTDRYISDDDMLRPLSVPQLLPVESFRDVKEPGSSNSKNVREKKPAELKRSDSVQSVGTLHNFIKTQTDILRQKLGFEGGSTSPIQSPTLGVEVKRQNKNVKKRCIIPAKLRQDKTRVSSSPLVSSWLSRMENGISNCDLDDDIPKALDPENLRLPASFQSFSPNIDNAKSAVIFDFGQRNADELTVSNVKVEDSIDKAVNELRESLRLMYYKGELSDNHATVLSKSLTVKPHVNTTLWNSYINSPPEMQPFPQFPIAQRVESRMSGIPAPYSYEWLIARVKDYGEGRKYFVHYEGWGLEYDEWIAADSGRIRPCAYNQLKFGPFGPEPDGKWQSYLDDYHREIQNFPKTTGLVFHKHMLCHKCLCPNNDDANEHPERPMRLVRILSELEKYGYLNKCLRLEARLVKPEELLTMHSLGYLKTFSNQAKNDTNSICNGAASDAGNTELTHLEILRCGGVGFARDTYYNPETTPYAACLSAGSLMALAQDVMEGKIIDGFALIRPPGHHASRSSGGGFCYFNNVAITAKDIWQKYKSKILIVDFDIHHGNGTEELFYNDPNIMYISLHRYDDGNFYPHSGPPEDTGEREGEGFNVNIAWNGGTTLPYGDTEYLAAFYHIVMPIAQQFNPQMVIVSAGFDASVGHEHVGIGGYQVTDKGFATMIKMLKMLANGRLIMALEGGYAVQQVAECAAACIGVLLHHNNKEVMPSFDFLPSLSSLKPHENAVKSMKTVLDIQSKYWKFGNDLTFSLPAAWKLKEGPRIKRGRYSK